MGPETIEAIKSALIPIAEKIGQGAGYAWDAVVWQQKLIAIQNLMWVVPGVVMIYFGAKLLKHSWPKLKANEYVRHGDVPVAPIIGGFFLFGGMLFVTGGIFDAIAHWLNPAYYALDFFINIARPIAN